MIILLTFLIVGITSAYVGYQAGHKSATLKARLAVHFAAKVLSPSCRLELIVALSKTKDGRAL